MFIESSHYKGQNSEGVTCGFLIIQHLDMPLLRSLGIKQNSTAINIAPLVY